MRLVKEMKDPCQWHNYFAWFPTCIKWNDTELQWVWFETIERRKKRNLNSFSTTTGELIFVDTCVRGVPIRPDFYEGYMKKTKREQFRLHSSEDLALMVQDASEEKLRNAMLSIVLNNNMTQSFYHKINALLSKDKTSQALSLKAYCNIRPGLRFRYIDILALSESYMMDYIPELIEAAERNDGPHATREIMLIAAAMRIEAESKCPFTTLRGIPMRDKVYANYILRIAGYELRSKFFPELRQSRKVWVKTHGFKGWTKAERILEVEFQVSHSLKLAEDKTDAKVNSESALNNII